MTLPVYELYALRYAFREARRAEHFIGGDPHDGPMPMDYFVWIARSPERTVVIDCGYTEEVSRKRGRTYLRNPVEALSLLGIAPGDVTDVVLTHMHYDHVGNLDRFPKARFYLQEAEIHYATGHYMAYPKLAHSFEVDDVCTMVRLNFGQRVSMLRGPYEVAPGLTLHPVGGHSAGLQFACVNTARGTVVVASDVTHFYENMESGRPFTTAFHIGEMLDAYETLRRMAPSADHIVPGHDPEVMRRYPAATAALDGIVVRLDAPPRYSSETPRNAPGHH